MHFLIRLGSVAVLLVAALPAAVEISLNGRPARPGDYQPAGVQELTLRNGRLAITFGADGSASSLIKDGRELVCNLNGIVERDKDAKRAFYIDYTAGNGHLAVDIIRIVKVTPEMAHIAIVDAAETSAFYLERHVLLMNGESRLYGYVIGKNPKNRRLGGEMRSMYRFDRDILDWAYVSERNGHQPSYGELVQYPSIQDETWLPDGSIYQKHDCSGYMAENPVWGHYGHGFGAWFMPVSAEYHAGGPLRQDLMVHREAPALPAGQAHLAIAIAGVGNNPHLTVSVNAAAVQRLSYANDAATYRAALRSARYQLEEIAFPANLPTSGANAIRLGMTAAGKNGGIMYDNITLEVE